MKLKVILESIPDAEEDLVDALGYDRNSLIVTESFGVMTRDEAYKKFEVVGEMVNGDIRMFKDEDYEDDFEDDSEDDEDEEW
jgi:hypothetical protein